MIASGGVTSREDGGRLGCRAVVITTGTFLNGLTHVGRDQRPEGRHGEPPSLALAESFEVLAWPWAG